MNKPTINQQNSTDVNSYACYYERVKTGSIEKFSAKGCSDAKLDQFGRFAAGERSNPHHRHTPKPTSVAIKSTRHRDRDCGFSGGT